MTTPLNAEELRAKTLQAKERIHRATYATPEDVQAFFEDISEETIRNLQQMILNRVHSGLSEAYLTLSVPRRVFRSLNIGTSKYWDMYETAQPFPASCIRTFVQKVADVTIKCISYNEIANDEAYPTQTLWITVGWD